MTAQQRRAQRDELKQEAVQRTQEAEQAIADFGHVLISLVEASPVFDISKQRIASQFDEREPSQPKYLEYPRQPQREDWTFVPQFNLLDKLIPYQRKRKLRLGQERSENSFLKDHAQWVEKCKAIEKANEKTHTAYKDQHAKWSERRRLWQERRDATNNELSKATAGLRNGDAESVYWLFQNVWNGLPLPEDVLSGEYQLHFDEDAKTLIIDLDLPEYEKTPNVKSVRYIASRDELEDVMHKEGVVRSIYDEFVYQIALGVPYAFLSCDSEQAVQAVVLNGWVTYINRASGNKTTACIVSLHCEASELSKINMRDVDAKTCFRSLKGVASPQINSLTPIRPIINVDRTDQRFVNSHDVIEGMGSGANLAAIGWEEFESI